MSRAQEIEKLEQSIEDIAEQRQELSAKMRTPGIELTEFMALADKDKQLSVRQFTARRKVANINAKKSPLGDALPEQATSTKELQLKGGQRGSM